MNYGWWGNKKAIESSLNQLMQSRNVKVNLEQCFWFPSKQFHKRVVITFSQREIYLQLLDNRKHFERFQIFVTRVFKDVVPHKPCKERSNLQPFNSKRTPNVQTQFRLYLNIRSRASQLMYQ